MTPANAAFASLLLAAVAPASTRAAERLDGGPAKPPGIVRVADVTLPCAREFGCVTPIDRDVRPFEGALGRPCGYRWRATPSGTRKVRVCY